jgi:parvulin-like peptidyl-prolyl isomerase
LKKTGILALILLLAVAACSSKKVEATKLALDSPAYKLGKDLAAVLPILDPDKNAVLITAKHFTVTAGDVLDVLKGKAGSQADQLKQFDAARLKTIIRQEAAQIGERKLLLEAAAEAKSVLAPDQLNAALKAQYDQAGGEAQYQEALKTNGVSFEFFKNTIGEDMLIRSFLTKTVFASIKIDPAEVEKAYAEDKTATVRHILLLTQGKPEAEKPQIRKKMEGILERARKGEDFAALAKEFTEDPGSKQTGGLYEDFERGKMVKPFEEAAFTTPIGQISGIVETAYGYHILKIENRKKESQPLDQIKGQIEDNLKRQKQGAAYEAYINELKAKATFVEVR